MISPLHLYRNDFTANLTGTYVLPPRGGQEDTPTDLANLNNDLMFPFCFVSEVEPE